MSYGRILETGHYIWPDEKGVHFDNVYVPNETLNVFLVRLKDRPKEYRERLKLGKQTLKQHKMNLGDLYDKE